MFARTMMFGVLAAGCSLVHARADEPLKHTKDSLATVQENLKAGKAIIVDVREDSERKEAYLAGSIHMPQSKLAVKSDLVELIKKLPKDKLIYTHCRAGRRSLACGEILKQQGFDVRPLAQGTDELLNAGFERGKE
jgi:rhodanese-related sulfurtransferase